MNAEDILNRTSSQWITSLKSNEIFVFASNMEREHLGGAARMANDKFGAVMYNPDGYQGQCYAIPTLSFKDNFFGLKDIEEHVNTFFISVKKMREEFPALYSHVVYLVTEIGCGIAGYTPEQIAPMFKEAIDLPYVHLPARFWEVILKDQ